MNYIILGTMLLVVALCEAHLCLFNPLQRGTMNEVNSAGEVPIISSSTTCHMMSATVYSYIVFQSCSHMIDEIASVMQIHVIIATYE